MPTDSRPVYIGRTSARMLDAEPPDIVGVLVKAILAWALRDELPQNLPDELRGRWAVIEDESITMHDLRDKRSEAGRRGGEANRKQTEANAKQSGANGSKAEQTPSKPNQKEKEKETENIPLSSESGARTQKPKRETFPPPATVAEVVAFCREKKIIIDASRFVNYFSAQGWRLANGNKMKDWHAAVLNWHDRDKPAKPSNPTTPTLRNETGLTAYRPADGIDCSALGI